jgi:hypothetical protein
MRESRAPHSNDYKYRDVRQAVPCAASPAMTVFALAVSSQWRTILNDIAALRHSFSCPQVGLLLHFSRSGCSKSAGGRSAPKKKLSDLGHSLASFGNTTENSEF